MRYLITVVIAALSLNAFGQVPDYVPQDGLVAWYPFDNGATDFSGNGFDGANNGAQIVASNFGNALLFDGANDYVEIPTNSSFESLVDELTLSAWFNKTNTSNGSIIAKRNFVGNPCGERHHFELTCMSDNSILFSASHNCIEIHTSQIQTEDDVFELNTWNHVALTYNNGSIQLYLNGVLILTHYEGYRELLPNGHWLNFGRIHRSGGTAFFNEFGGQIDESGIWGRALSAIEIASLFNTSTPIEGCTDGAACNFDSDADIDDDSCWYLDLLINGLDVDDYTNCWYDIPSIDLSVAQPLLSNVYSDNIEWTSGVIDGAISGNITTDAPLQTTVYTVSVTLDGYTCESSVNVNVEESCSEGCTDSAACNFNNIASFDDGSCDYSCCQGAECCGNGTVWDEVNYRCVVANITDTNLDGCTDLNDLMDILSAYGDCSVPAFNCGDDIEHEDYVYSSVQIGEQCWFAENCRYLPVVSSPLFGSEEDGLAYAYVYNYYGDDIEAAKLENSYIKSGALYNVQAIESWVLCPNHWHAAHESDWLALEEEIGIEIDQLEILGWRGSTEGYNLKVNDCDGSWNGSNIYGFSARGHGTRSDLEKDFIDYCIDGNYHTLTNGTAEYYRRAITSYQNGIYRDNASIHAGMGVRCIKD